MKFLTQIVADVPIPAEFVPCAPSQYIYTFMESVSPSLCMCKIYHIVLPSKVDAIAFDDSQVEAKFSADDVAKVKVR